ncbi:hypothetical protein [Fibrella forsythiae]|uniref:Uncharacterized protein n=1 Tax=Fibrella forsythiae TaxID=2817061 RepID=A0ABS3JNR7_9BACT|nr:hypothetical protein [Fibrella forsythiae]MBO0950864.1 hypothetical protein [Fibrella forsythiae]
MKGFSYYQSGQFVAFAYNLDTQEIIKASCRPGAATIGQADYSLLPVCTRCEKADYDAIKEAALAELSLIDQEAFYSAAIDEYEAQEQAKYLLYA